MDESEESESEDDDEFEGESSICFENIDIAKYNTEQINSNNQSPLKSQETASDEVLNTKDDMFNAAGDLTQLHHKRMKSPDVKKMMNKAYLFMNSKVPRQSSVHNSADN